MSKDSIDEMSKSGSGDFNSEVFKSALFIDVPIEARIKETAESLDVMKLSSRENLQTPVATPKQSDKNFLSSDLMKRLEENSPIKSHRSNDDVRKFSDLCLVNCESEGDLGVLTKQVHKISDKFEPGNKRILGKDKFNRNQSTGSHIGPKTEHSTRNFKLKTNVYPSNLGEDDYFDQSEISRKNSNLIQAKEEPKSLFNNSFRNFQQASNFFSPTYTAKQTKQVRGDSSPIYSYYDGTAECLSQTFFDEFKKSNNDQFMSKNNFIKKSESQIENSPTKFEKGVSGNFFEEMSRPKQEPQGKRSELSSHSGEAYQDFMEPSIFFGKDDSQNSSQNFAGTNSNNPNVNTSIGSNSNTKDSLNSKKRNQIVNNNKNQAATLSSEGDEYAVEMFGRKGWICEMCNNFNYESKIYFTI